MSVECLEVVKVSELAWLTHAFSVGESSATIETETVIHIVKVANIEKYGADGSTCSSLPTIAVDNQHVLIISYQISDVMSKMK